MNTKGKRFSQGMYICFALTVAVVFFGATSSLQAKPVTLRFASYQPPRGLEGETPKWMMEEITKRTNGQVTFEQYFAGSLLQAREVLKGVQSKTADMGYVFTAYFPKELGMMTLPHPFIRGPVDPAKTVAFFEEFFKEFPEADKEIQKWNQKRLGIHIFGKLAVGSHNPMKDLKSVSGLKIRAPGGYAAQWLKCLGASVVFLGSSDVYSAFQKKAIDSVFSPPTSQFRSKWYETASPYYLLTIPMFSGVTALITINMDTWNSLPPSVQEVIAAVGEEYGAVLAKKIVAEEKEDISKMASLGAKILEASKQDIAYWADKCEGEAKEKWISEADKLGLPGKKLMERFIKLIQKHSD